ncbi:MAG: chromosomal replication initiator protein DnaA, partial [Rhodospirillaceae bacterium]|nr:chromosomal replication initiator protein DnaA [Rhodospirillaceae bacterium]
MCDWVKTHYADRIRALWASENPAVKRISIKVATGVPAQAPVASAQPAGLQRPSALNMPTPPTPQRQPVPFGSELSASLDPRYTFANFVVGKPNEFAYAAAKRVAEADEVSFNP